MVRSRIVRAGADQAAYAGGNALLVLTVAQLLGPGSFSMFAAAYAIGVVASSGTRAMAAEDLIIRCSSQIYDWARCVRRSVGAAAAAVLVLLVLDGAAVLPDYTGTTAALAAMVAAMAFIDGPRNLFLGSGMYGSALARDTIWLVATLLACGGALLGWWGPDVAVAAYASVGVLVFSASLPRQPEGRASGTPMDRSTWALVAENMLAFGAAQVLALGAGIMSSGVDLAVFRLLQTAYGPIGVVLAAARMPLLRVLAEGHTRRSIRAAWSLLGGTGALTVALVGGLLLVPEAWVRLVFGTAWVSLPIVVIGFGIHRLSVLPLFLVQAFLRTSGRITESLRLRLVSATATLIVGGSALLVFGGLGEALAAVGIVHFAFIGAVSVTIRRHAQGWGNSARSSR